MTTDGCIRALPALIPEDWWLDVCIGSRGIVFRLEDPNGEGVQFDSSQGYCIETFKNALDTACALDENYTKESDL